MSLRILIAEDETKIADILSEYLAAAGMRSVCVDDGAAVLDAIKESNPALILLDLMLPNVDGLTLCRKIREAGNLPIIMVTARVEEIDRLLGLELGADDYICKPFSPREVVARVKTVLRRAGTMEPVQTVSIETDEQRYTASLNGTSLQLTPVEFRLLHLLSSHPGRVYRRDDLLDRIYDDYREVSDRTIDSHIKNLRKKLAAIAPNQSLIVSVYGIGYKFEADSPIHT